MLENVLDLPAAVEEDPFVADGCPEECLSLQTHQQVQAMLSTAARGLGLATAVQRRVSAAVGSVCEKMPGVLVSLAGPLGTSDREALPGKTLVKELGGSVRNLRHCIRGC